VTGFLGALAVIVAVIAGFVANEPIAFLSVLAVEYVLIDSRK